MLNEHPEAERPSKDGFVVLKDVRVQSLDLKTSLNAVALVLFIDQIGGCFLGTPPDAC
jgi:hypothetical protein